MSSDRLALLKAILANSDDDLPRLVFADWLEENGTSDADAARVEFIRLGCKSKAKTRMSHAEGKWLDSNWRRLLGQTLARHHPNSLVEPPVVRRDGRFLRLRFRWYEPGHVRVGEMDFEYVHGFARRVGYQRSRAYDYFWKPAATDEPLAYHRPERLPDTELPASHSDMITYPMSRLVPTTWGEEVYDHTFGYDEEQTPGVSKFKLFHMGNGDLNSYHPLAILDENHLRLPHHRLRAAVATAMTAIAREYVGLAPGS